MITDWRTVVRLALRDLRGGIRGFSVFVICVALGVAVIAAVGVVSDSLNAGFATEGRQMLGGDLAVNRVHGRVNAEERRDLEALGRVSEVATLRGMAQAASGPEAASGTRVMVAIKAVDEAYPLIGKLEGQTTANPRAKLSAERTVVVAPILLERLRVKIGDRLALGNVELTIIDTIKKEPDSLSGRAAFGPRVLMSMKSLEATKLVSPGSLVRWRYRVALAEGDGPDGFAGTVEGVKAAFAPKGYSVRDRRDPSPGVTVGINRFREFLTLVGLTAMLVGGVGVANAVSSYLDGRATTIATFRAIGAGRRTVFSIYLFEILIIAALGVALGLLLGLGLPFLGWQLFGGAVPLPIRFSVSPSTVLVATGYGFLVSLAFVLWPLGRVDQVKPAMLFRDRVAPERSWPRPAILGAIAVVLGALAALTVAGSEQWTIVLGFFAGIGGLFLVFLALAWVIRTLAVKVPRFGTAEFVLAVRNLAGPGALTQAVVLSLGTGLSLLVAVTLTDASLVRELTTRLPEKAPSFYFVDVNKNVADAFQKTVTGVAPKGELREAPMLRGRITELGGRRPDQVKPKPGSEWVLNGDRGLTFSEDIPQGSRIVAGNWWPKDYSGPPLLSFEAELAEGLGLKIGDDVVVNVLGRPVRARIANLREVNWGSLAINFVLIYSPNTLQAAPFNYIYTLTYPEVPSLKAEADVLRAVGKQFPEVTAIRVKDALDAAGRILERIMMAIRVVGGLTLLVGAVVLAGAITTSQRRRTGQAVLLKTLGATRGRIMRANFYEFLVLGVAVSAVGVLLGTVAAWIMTQFVLDVEFQFAGFAVLEALGLALGLTALLGAISLRRVLNAPAVPYLRTT